MSWVEPQRGAGVDAAEPGQLAGLRVLDFSTLLPGPFATQILADLGADVVKVERPQGDEARRFPSGLHAVANRGKRSVVADLAKERDRVACLTLAAEADVVVEGFRAGVADRLGVGYEQVRGVNPDVVYCSITGFGQSGPNRDKPGHDLTFLAVSGALSYSAHWGEPPRRSGVPVGDMAGSTYAVIAILVALREREATGAGAHLDVAIADAAMAFASTRGGPDFTVRDEDQLSAYATNEVYVSADGVPLALCAVEEKFWRPLRAALREHAPALGDPQFDTAEGRRRHGDELKLLLAGVIGARGANHWIRTLQPLDVSIEPVLTLAQAAQSPQARARGVVSECEGERQVVFPVLRDGVPLGRFRSRAPALGEHTEVLTGGGR